MADRDPIADLQEQMEAFAPRWSGEHTADLEDGVVVIRDAAGHETMRMSLKVYDYFKRAKSG